jgi:outer membrane protein OmpA-like peptidoglycan-associated protein
MDLGGVMAIPGNSNIESDKTGYLVDGGGILSLYTKRATIDLGIGAFYSRIQGSAKPVVEAGKPVDRDQISFTAALATVSARFRPTRNFEIGPIFHTTFGADGTWSPEIESESVPRVSMGLQATKIWTDFLSYDFRVNARFGIDLNIPDRNVLQFAIGVAFGLPFNQPDTIVKTQIKTKTKVKTETRIVERPVYQAIYVFQTDAINFEYNRAVLLPESKAFLEDLGRLLASRASWWQTLQVAGHTDQTGALDYNMKLSQDRAEVVRATLITAGVAPERLEARGYGPTVPLSEETDPVSLAKNRRVELMFGGEVDQMRLGPELDRVRRKHEKPKTCVGQDCR